MPKADDFFNNNGMNRIFNTFGLKSLDRGLNIPDSSLAIGYGEVLRPVPVLMSYTPIMPSPVVEPIKSVDDTFIKTDGQRLNMDTFAMEGYFGEVVGVY